MASDTCTCSPYFGCSEYAPDCPRHSPDPTALALAASLRAAREAEDKARFAAALGRVSGR